MSDAPFMHSPDDLKRWMEAGSKPREAWRIGTEHEKFGYRSTDFTPLP